MRPRIILSLRAAAILLAGWLVYAPALRGGWLWDDDGEISSNRALREASGLWRAWVRPGSVDYQPLRTTVQWIQWHLWGSDTLGYHLTNLGLHLASAFLLWAVLARLGARRAWIGGLLFAVHPLAVESVAWISELKNTLSLFLVLLSLLAYLRWDEGGSRRRPEDGTLARQARPYAASLILFTLAMLSKGSVVLFPVVLLLHAWWKRGRIAWSDLRACAPYFAVSIVLGIVAVRFQLERAIGVGGLRGPGLAEATANSGMAIAFYLSKCVFPAGLIPIYPAWPVHPSLVARLLPWVAAAALFWWLRARPTPARRAVLLGGGCFLVGLFPALGIIPIAYQRIAPVADHFAYLSLVAVAGLGAAGLGRIEPMSRAGRMMLWSLVAAAAGGLAMSARAHALVFRSEKDLWTATVARNPDTWLGCNNFGVALREERRLPEAISWFNRALAIRPDYAEAENDLGVALADSGRPDEAIVHYGRALRLDPSYADAHGNLGNALLTEGRMDEALAEYARAIRLAPGSAEARNNLGVALARLGRVAGARTEFEAALAIRPEYPEALSGLGNCMALLGSREKALALYGRALALRPGYADCRNNLGLVLESLGKRDEAREQFRRVLATSPGDTTALRELRKIGLQKAER